MNLKPQDLLVALKFASSTSETSASAMAADVGLSTTEAIAAARRAIAAQLLAVSPLAPLVRPRGRPSLRVTVNRAALVEFVTHGVRYVFVPERGALTRGMPTAHGAPPLSEVLSAEGPVPVWPDPRGEARGEAFSPLYKSCVLAARRDPALYALLALVDGARSPSARERALAAELFAARVKAPRG